MNKLIQQIFGTIITAGALYIAVPAWSQVQPATNAVERPDAERTRQEFLNLTERYPPSLRQVIALDPTLLNNQAYLGPYPALQSFLNAHPEIVRNPEFYAGEPEPRRNSGQAIWSKGLDGLGVLLGFGMFIGVMTWLVRTVLNYRRWNRLTKVQTDVHTKLLDRFTANEDLLAYIQSPAGSKFLESTPITLDAGPRSLAAPLGRILLSVQAGLIITAGGVGMWVIGDRIADEAAQAVHALGILLVAVGAGFLISAGASFFISRRLGLINPPGVSA